MDRSGEDGVTIRRAGAADRAALLPLIEEFYAVDHHDFVLDRVTAALDPLLADDRYGAVWLIERTAEPADAVPLGYAVVTWGYSLEAGGVEAVLDEIFVRERGDGAGASALAEICRRTARAGASRIYLETEAANSRVRRFYARNGFELEDSVWMGRWLDGRPTGHP
jgi:RimJ/RimL family protein N-acetyltransferase